MAPMTAPHSVARAGVAIAGAALGIASVMLARRHPEVSLAGDAPWASAAQLLAGWGLVAGRPAPCARRPSRRRGPLPAAPGPLLVPADANRPRAAAPLILHARLAAFPP